LINYYSNLKNVNLIFFLSEFYDNKNITDIKITYFKKLEN